MSEQHLPVGTPVAHGPWRGVVCGLTVTDDHIEYYAHDEQGQRRTFAAGELQRIEQPKPLAVRPIVAAFAEAMEAKLAANDGVKGEWRATDEYDLLEALELERIELRDAVIGGLAGDVLSEACDVALYALMIADACGALPATTDRGRAYAESVAVKGE